MNTPTPCKGCSVTQKYLGDVEVWIEYAYDEGEPEVRYYKDGSGHPGSPAFVEVTDVFINGQWTRDVSFIDGTILSRWEDEILETCTQAESDAEAEAADRWIDEQKEARAFGGSA